MDSLLEKRRYDLSNNEENGSNKTVVVVKFTDSGLKSIDEYLKQPGCFKPSIQFGEHNGVINIPVGNGMKQYNFILQGIEGKENESSNFPNKSFECVQQKRNGSLESVGYVAAKMQIQAKDDIYENTRCKITAANKEQKQFGTKVIKQTGSHLGQQVKVNQPKNIAISSNSCSVPVFKSIGPMKRKYNAGHPFRSSPVSSVRCDSNPPVKPVSVLSSSPGSNFPKKENSTPKVPSGIQRQPIRDRVIHLLALRPWKKLEILAKIGKEGVNEKINLSEVLNQVSTLKKNCYHLSDGLWREVRDNWKFYSSEQAEFVRKKKQEYLQRQMSSDIQSSSSTKEYLPNESTTSPYPHGAKRRISHLNGTSSHKHKQDGYPKNEVKSPSFFKAESLQTNQITCSAIIEIPEKDHENNAINQVCQPINLFSPEFVKKSIDQSSPSTQSSGYKSMSSSQRSDEVFTNTTKKSEHKYLPVFNLGALLSEKNVNVHEQSRSNSSLTAAIPPYNLGSNKARKHENNAINQVSQPTNLFSPEYGKKSIDQSSPSTQSSGYKSMSSSQGSDEVFTNTTKKSEPKYLPKLKLGALLSEKNVNVHDLSRRSNSSFSSAVPPSNLGSNKKKYIQKTATLPSEQEKEIFKQKHPISAIDENEIVNSLSYSAMPSSLSLARDSSAVQLSTTECETKGDLKLVVKHLGEKQYKIQDKKAVKPSKESFHPTHKKNHQISSGESSKQLKTSDAAAGMSTANSSMISKQPEFILKPDEPSSCLTEPCFLSSNQDVVGYQSSTSPTTIEYIANEETSKVLSKFENFKRQFVKIVSQEQKKQYEAIVAAESSEYNPLFIQVNEIQQYFVALNKQFEESPRGTKEFERLERTICEEYKAANTIGFKEKREKCIYVFEKLQYIKQLIKEYEKEQLERH